MASETILAVPRNLPLSVLNAVRGRHALPIQKKLKKRFSFAGPPGGASIPYGFKGSFLFGLMKAFRSLVFVTHPLCSIINVLFVHHAHSFPINLYRHLG